MYHVILFEKVIENSVCRSYIQSFKETSPAYPSEKQAFHNPDIKPYVARLSGWPAAASLQRQYITVKHHYVHT